MQGKGREGDDGVGKDTTHGRERGEREEEGDRGMKDDGGIEIERKRNKKREGRIN